MSTKRFIGADWIADSNDGITLRISVCRRCAGRWFPPRGVCPNCALLELTQTTTGSHGIAYASTVVRAGPASFQPPYVLSYVDIDGVRLLAHVEADRAPEPGTPVQLTTGLIGVQGDTEVWSYRVRPTEGGQR